MSLKGRASHGRCAIVVALVLPLLARAAPSPAAQLAMRDFTHQAWTAAQGAPSGIRHLAQGPDGALFLTSADGVFRFDGVGFERIPAAAGTPIETAAPASLLVTRAGEVWVGYAGGAGLGVMRAGRIAYVPMPDPPTQVSELSETRDGALWVGYGGGDRRLARLYRGRWQGEARLRLPPGRIDSLAAAPDGALWASLDGDSGAPGRLARSPPGGGPFVTTPVPVKEDKLFFAPDGRLWASNGKGTRLLLEANGGAPGHRQAYPAPSASYGPELVFDRWGGAWGSTRLGGLFHIASLQPGRPTRIEHLGRADGLSSDQTNDVHVDRDDNVWVATELGLDRFSRAAIIDGQVPAPPHGLSIAQLGDGHVAIGAGRRLLDVAPGEAPGDMGPVQRDIAALCPASTGGVWVALDRGVLAAEGRSRTPTPSPPWIANPSDCAQDARGRLWIDLQNGLAVREHGAWRRLAGLPAQPDIWDVAAVGAPLGDVAFTLKRLSVGLTNGVRVALVGPDKLKVGVIHAIAPWAGGLLVAGDKGLARVQASGVQVVDPQRNPWTLDIRSLFQARDGQVWLLRRSGLVRVAGAGLQQAFATPGRRVTPTVLDAHDGGESFTQHVGWRGPQLAEGGDGRIWFLNALGAAYVDPQMSDRNRRTGPVRITSLRAGEQLFRDAETVSLKPGSSEVDLSYTSYTLSAPDLVRFRYRLAGVDPGWVDAGPRRLASYSNLGPGRYRFEAQAALRDGPWVGGDAATFTIAPTFLQSWAFKLIAAAPLLLLLWLLYALRLRQVSARVRLAMQERLDERERIARELHDTLLQAIHGLMLRFQVLAYEWPADSAARARVEAALDQADAVIAEGRDRVRDLRPPPVSTAFEDCVADAARRLVGDGPPRFVLSTSGKARFIDPLAGDELLKVVAEAISNAVRHAAAADVRVEVHYGATELRITISDNGAGIDEAVLRSGHRPGHFGLQGMRERARKLAGHLRIERLEPGTRVTLRAPAAVVYAGGAAAPRPGPVDGADAG